ncbi:MAG: hypothetical protein H6900_06160 [Rhodobacter sp.]|uniref:hypothetical protein n=1 Tax=Pararhodobacter sp. TaxID=2127056 RepID=UPI001D9FC057|nr:hypothetical protein [Pararhodobacter sp.]MCB1345090.1 hypothetical protein [Paracoccaceae bacterium]MCC0072858.1 hypothetical protein [Rhodobacter sp.]HPD92494.1 hypothetical protein [Pararhodobacter sp.]
MTLAAPFRAPDRARPLALLPAAAVAGFGLGLAGLAVTAPAPPVTPLPPVSALAADRPADAPERAARVAWPPLFGTPAPQAAPAPVSAPRDPEPVAETGPIFDPGTLVLRGVVVDAQGSIALIDTPQGAVLGRVGDRLADGAEIVTIDPEGIEVVLDDQLFAITFDETAPPPTDDRSVEGPLDEPARPVRQRAPARDEGPVEPAPRGMFGALAPYVPSPPQIGGPPPRTTPQGARAGQPTTGSNR